MAHAYLFAGRRESKALMALQFAQMLNCRRRPTVRRMQGVREDRFWQPPDVGSSALGRCATSGHDHSRDNSRDIQFYQIRRLEQMVSRAPYEGRRRRSSSSPRMPSTPFDLRASKTLEGLPPYVVFMLITDLQDLLLDTVRSRARRVPFAGQSRETTN